MTFAKAIAFSLAREGGYVRDPLDPGGETNYGISKRAHADVDIAGLTSDAAAEIYHRDYWPSSGGEIAVIGLEAGPRETGALEAAVFDFAVHSGNAQATRTLQKLVGAEVDGKLGPRTRRRAERRAFELLALEYVDARRSFLVRLIHKREQLRRFSSGWLGRCSLLAAAIRRGDFS